MTQTTRTTEDALTAILALRKVTHETNTQTRRSQNRILQSLDDAGLTAVSLALTRHQEQFGW